VLAEELGRSCWSIGLWKAHAAQPGRLSIGLLRERRIIYEHEARAFAAEPLMLFTKARRHPDVQRVARESHRGRSVVEWSPECRRQGMTSSPNANLISGDMIQGDEAYSFGASVNDMFSWAPLGHARHRQGSLGSPSVSEVSVLCGFCDSGDSAD
jgi:hypothetical protein